MNSNEVNNGGDINTPPKSNKVVYDVISKTFIDYDIYVEQYRVRMYGPNKKNENISINIVDGVKYFD